MKLKEIISEMSMPTFKTPEEAVTTINQAYNDVVKRKMESGDHYGPLSAAAKYLSGLTNPEKYSQQIKMAISAKKMMDKYKAGKATQQAKFTTVK